MAREEKNKKISVLLRTMVNGYALDIDGEGYMYFNAQSMLEGFLVHVGLERLEAMTKEEIKEMLNSIKDGSALKKMQAEVNALNDTVAELRKQVREQKKVIKELSKEA